MKNLLKFEFRKLKKQKSFYICTVIAVALLFLFALTVRSIIWGDSAPAEEELVTAGIGIMVGALSNSSFIMIAGIFVVLFVCEDYSTQTVKNIYARGYSGKQVYFAKLISALLGTTVMFAVVEVAAFAIRTAFFGFGNFDFLKFLELIGIQYTIVVANIALDFALASTIRKNGGAIASVILVPMLVGVVTGFADSFLKSDSFSFTSLWLSEFLSDVSVMTVSPKRMVICLVGSLIYIPLFVTAGVYLHQKSER